MSTGKTCKNCGYATAVYYCNKLIAWRCDLSDAPTTADSEACEEFLQDAGEDAISRQKVLDSGANSKWSGESYPGEFYAMEHNGRLDALESEEISREEIAALLARESEEQA